MKYSWKTVKAKDFISFNPRIPLRKEELSKKISMDKLQPYSKIVSGFEWDRYKGGAKFSNGDTIMARITPCLENGKTAYVDFLDDDEVAFGSTEFIVLRAKEGISDPQFIYYTAINPSFRSIAIQSMVGSSGRQRVQQGVLDNTMLYVPDLPIQKKIASMLNSFDEKIKINLKIHNVLEQQAQAMYVELFCKDTSFWKTGTIDSLGTIIGGGTPSKSKPEYFANNEIAWITPKDLALDRSKFISRGKIDISEIGLKKSSARLMPKGTVLFSSRAPIGYIAIASGDVSTNQGFRSIIPHPQIGTAFVYFFLKNNLHIIKNMASGTTFKEVSGSVLKAVPAIIPDDQILKQFADFCTPIFEKQWEMEQESCVLANIRDTLLPKLMSGEIQN